MAVKTRLDLINRALTEIGKLESGQTASAEDVATVDELVDPMIEDLSARQVIHVADAGDPGPTGGQIEAAPFLHLARLLGELIAPGFGRSSDAGAMEFAERRLRTLSRVGRGSGSMLRVDGALRPARRAFDFATGR